MGHTSDVWILALDAATPRSVIAIGRVHGDGDTLALADALVDGPNQASSTLLPRVEALLQRAGVDRAHIGAVACGRGPGMFTGTRVAIASAMGLAMGLSCPLIGLSTLGAVACSGSDDRVLALLDARRGEVYGGVWTCGRDDAGRPRARAEGQERCVPIEALLDELGDDTPKVAIGPGVEPHRALLEARGLEPRAEAGPTPAGLWHAAVAAWHAGAASDPERLRAVYLRQSYAELGVNAPKRVFVRSPFV